MERLLIQSRTAKILKRSKYFYFPIFIFHYLFRSKNNVRINSIFCYLDNPIEQYLYKKPTLLFNLVIVGFFLCLKKDNHFIYTFNF